MYTHTVYQWQAAPRARERPVGEKGSLLDASASFRASELGNSEPQYQPELQQPETMGGTDVTLTPLAKRQRVSGFC